MLDLLRTGKRIATRNEGMTWENWAWETPTETVYLRHCPPRAIKRVSELSFMDRNHSELSFCATANAEYDKTSKDTNKVL